MSFQYEIRGNLTSDWDLTDSSVRHLELLRKTELRHAVDLVIGDAETHAGEWKQRNRLEMLAATKQLLPAARKMPRGFRIRTLDHCKGLPKNKWPYAQSIGGVSVDGKAIFIQCHDDFWEVNGVRKVESGSFEYKEGTVVVEPKPGSSDLVKLLRDVHKFLEKETTETVSVIWG